MRPHLAPAAPSGSFACRLPVPPACPACRVPPGLRACPGPTRPVVPDSSSVRCAGGLLWSSPPARGGTPPVRPPRLVCWPPIWAQGAAAPQVAMFAGNQRKVNRPRSPQRQKARLRRLTLRTTPSKRQREPGNVSFAGGPHGRDRGSLSPSDHVPGRVPGRVPAPGRAAGARSRAGRPGSDQREQRCSPFLQRTLTELRQEPRARTGTDMALCRHHGPPVGVAFPLRVGLFLSKCRRFILWTRSPRSDRM